MKNYKYMFFLDEEILKDTNNVQKCVSKILLLKIVSAVVESG